MGLQMILPLLGEVLGVVLNKKEDIAAQVGTSTEVVTRVGEAIQNHMSKDERLLAQAAAEIEAARGHDVATQTTDERSVNIARGLVRPLITFAAMGWYVYARSVGIALQPEDYAIIGGVLAFWFGFRPFEKGPRKGPL